jgi:glycosyltransferase involved in cell wall biosynthesis
LEVSRILRREPEGTPHVNVVGKIQVTHGFTNLRSFGGAQSTLKQHWEHDKDWGIDSNFCIFFESDTQQLPRVRSLSASWRDTIRTLRKKYKAAIAHFHTEIALYHNVWGVPFLADLDESVRRIGLLHTSVTMEECLPAQRGLLDGLICLSRPLVDVAMRALPELAPHRITLLPSPLIVPKMEFATKASLKGRPLILGYAGRLATEDKRVDRLPELLRCLENARLNYRLEILGDGPLRHWLEQKLQKRAKAIFHGYQTGRSYWEILNSWDAIVFVSDVEGLPLSLLEALSCGVLPLFPKIGSGADNYARGVKEAFLYAPTDFSQVARVLSDLSREKEEEIVMLRARCRKIVEPHLGNAYFRMFSEFMRSIRDEPRISKFEFTQRPFYWTDFFPFALLRRSYPSGFYKQS